MGNMAKATRRSYSAAEREAAVADAAELGLTRAAKRHGIPTSTLCQWTKRTARERSEACVRSHGRTSPAGRGTGARPSARTSQSRKAGGQAGAPDSPAGPRTAKASGSPERRPAKRYTPSQIAQVVEVAARDGVSAAARKHGCSRFAVYAWLRKVERAAAGEGPSPTSGPAQSEIEARRDVEILEEWKRHPGLGPSQVRNQLRRRGIKVSVHTVRRVMEADGYRPPKVERKPHDKRFDAVRPNHMWHLDFVKRYINKATTFTLILIDDCSRYVVGHGVDDAERADLVIETFEEAVRRHGRPESVMHDKGAAFWSWRGISRFTALLTEMDIDQIVAEHKEWNGKVEVFNGNLHKEFFEVNRFYDVAEMKRRLATHLRFYNHERTHQALGGLLVPADRYFGRAEEVLARIEAGEPRDPSDAHVLRNRCLDLFKVTSCNGVPEIWLMGQRLLSAPASN